MHRALAIILCLSIFVSCKNENKEKANQESGTKIVSQIQEDIILSSGSIYRIENFPSEFVKPRNVDIWLPENYSEDKKYSVLYMHDGQMLFDATKTWNKQEWKVDEWASQLMKENKTRDFIVIAIHNISEIRHNDYFPKQPIADNIETAKAYFNTINYDFDVSEMYSDDYLKFIVKELKPYIDTNFSTLRNKENTMVMGSSMGGLISMYAICEYPEIFGGAACLSTHWIGAFTNKDNPIPQFFIEYMDAKLPNFQSHKIYFDYGTKTLDSLYLPYQNKITSVLRKHGYENNNRFEDHDHSENSWNSRLDEPLIFLLKNE